ncbi:membrane protein [Mycobacteroides abscessus]|uniref:hypothetical protein n=1 Tax=Mycobacteroides abscessus TaxID=36809 RepID=UPI0003178095|nr:hypothetical protein [Mycobacteroides abscessus]MDO3298547.1 hypothetical protein [Mycobacteroides abscessus subsp. massiliense]CPT20665.1 membrane protein [Mycobacteroides abscessus]CPU24936.1 membrane protein [Mycobacteroides abscessus]SKI89017.1 membrane protein [Mycobacteroides abscessus subsp. massiliense]SKP22226.1 membrane protein [Mycobacteroides abscessus subsp. massiliense]
MDPNATVFAAIRRATAAALLLVMFTGCTHRDHDGAATTSSPAADGPKIPFTGLTQDLRFRWTAEPGIDLLTGPAVVIRAYRESFTLGGLMADPAYYYPGFDASVPPKNYSTDNYAARPLVKGEEDLRSSGFQTTTPIVGTWRQHILSLTGDDAKGYTALVCSWDYATGVQQRDSTYRYANRLPPKAPGTVAPEIGTNVYLIVLAPPSSTEPNPVTTRQFGSSPNPTTDVFGGWKITLGMDYKSISIEPPIRWPEDVYQRDFNTCVSKAPDSYEKRRFYLTGEHPKADFPTLPADPGWPAAGT